MSQRAALDAAAAGRQLATQGAQLTGGHVTPAFDPTTGETDGAAPGIAALTEDEAQLREVLRLEAIERRTRSLRSEPVAITYRRPAGAGTATPAAGAAAAVPAADMPAAAGEQDPASTPVSPASPDFLHSLAALQALDAQLTGESALDPRALPPGLPLQPPAEPSPLGPAASARIPQGDPLSPAVVQTPNDPARMGAHP